MVRALAQHRDVIVVLMVSAVCQPEQAIVLVWNLDTSMAGPHWSPFEVTTWTWSGKASGREESTTQSL